MKTQSHRNESGGKVTLTKDFFRIRMNQRTAHRSLKSNLLRSDVANRSANIVHHLRLVIASRVDNAIAGNKSLRQFGDAILKNKDLFLENMEIGVTNGSKKSQEGVERVVDIAQNHWLVQSGLK